MKKFLMKLIISTFLSLVFMLLYGCGDSDKITEQSPKCHAVSTFESMGIYWTPGLGSPNIVCNVQYKAKGTFKWKDAMPLWFDGRNGEYRGSIVNLKPGTEYKVKLTLKGTATSVTLASRTWNESFPVAKVVYLPNGTVDSTYTVNESGAADGYILYTSSPGGSTIIDVAGKHNRCITVDASYVIIDGLTLKGAAIDGIFLNRNVHDVVIQKCDISGWGRVQTDGWGYERDAGIHSNSAILKRCIIQGNKIHNPRSDSNNWEEYRTVYNEGSHPDGPEGIVFYNSAGNNVIRYNEIYSDEEHCFNDGISGSLNDSTEGSPGKDSDVYGNIVRNTWDDALEMDGGCCNVRVWGNLLDIVNVGISDVACSVGPFYVFRNVFARSRVSPGGGTAPFGKLGDEPEVGIGKQYWFHNTVLRTSYGLPVRGLSTYGGPYTLCVSRNNIYDAKSSIVSGNSDKSNDFDYDLCSGSTDVTYFGSEPHKITGEPVFAPGSGPESGIKGMFQLDPSSPGYHAAVTLPNFNGMYEHPDIGAHQSGTPPMAFGVKGFKAITPAKITAKNSGKPAENALTTEQSTDEKSAGIPATLTAEARKGTPVIDGKIDALWENTETIGVNRFVGGKTGESSAVVRALWDESNLYVLAEVKDEKLFAESKTAHYNDSVEIFVDEKDTKASEYGPGISQNRVCFNGTCTDGPGNKDVNFTGKTEIIPGGYMVEACIPWTVIKGNVKPGMTVGFDIQINDDASGYGRDYIIVWNGIDGNAWANPGDFGELKLAD